MIKMNVYVYCTIFFVIPGAYMINIPHLQNNGIFAFISLFTMLYLYKHRDNDNLQTFLAKWL